MRALLVSTLLASAAALIPLGLLHAQETATPNDVADERAGAYALVGASVTVAPGNTLDDAVVLIREGQIVAVTPADEAVPAGYATIALDGRHIYPGLIDIDAAYGLPAPAKRAPFSFSQAEVLESQTPGAYNPNQAIRAEYDAVSQFEVKAKDAATWRGLGFGAVLTSMADGIARGTGALVTLGDVSDNEAVLASRAAALYSFDKGSSNQSFPISPMGAIALLRQTYMDAAWYAAQSPKPFTDESLAAWNAAQALPQIFVADSWLAALRADKVGDEFGVQYVLRASGDAYQRLDAIQATGATLIVPLDFPDAQEVTDPFAADHVSITDLKHWELAPSNAARLEQAGVTFALTSGGDAKTFWPRLRKAIERGLSEEQALAALTTVPASILGESTRLGQLQPGALANLIVTSAPLFDEAMVIEENWVAGERYRVQGHTPDRGGVYALSVGELAYELRVSGKPTAPQAELRLPLEEAVAEAKDDVDEPKPIKGTLVFDGDAITLSFTLEGEAGAVRLGGWELDDHWAGQGRLADGHLVKWHAVRAGDLPADEDAGDEAEQPEDALALGEVIYPFNAYGTAKLPAPETLLIRNATVWTLEGEGKLSEADVLVRDGRIAAVGQGLSSRDARIIDATGMHVTPGIVDEHSHIALSGVNDIATNSSMVRMGDVVNSEDVNIYRNLAGGVTAAQLLHGSANPVGGQSALIKMRWGLKPEDMLIKGADGFIKFALGENVKRSRNPASVRYPQTRMGVEQVFRDGFGAARDYQAAWAHWNGLSRTEKARVPAPRRDLVMDAMAEILDSERFISCHSYVQSEINMLMHVAEDFGFRVNTFTHILEGYKVADKMAAHGAAGSSFSDWWAYKWEVRYAIPYNAALMTEAGVLSAINSDSAEMSRRLNQEAAKSVKYGGMSEVEALKLVTLNPAKMLHLDDRLGSLREGKDADLVIWTDHPLSIDAKVSHTLVDGVVRYDAVEHEARHAALERERGRLIEKMRAAKGPKGPGRGFRPERLWHCDSLHGYEYLDANASVH